MKTLTCGITQHYGVCLFMDIKLFLIYINDIQFAVTNAKNKLFADDTNLYLHGQSLEDIANATLIQLN